MSASYPKQLRSTLCEMMLAEGDNLLNEGSTVAEMARSSLGVIETTWHRWKNTYGEMKAVEIKRLKELENENRRLTNIIAETSPSRVTPRSA